MAQSEDDRLFQNKKRMLNRIRFCHRQKGGSIDIPPLCRLENILPVESVILCRSSDSHVQAVFRQRTFFAFPACASDLLSQKKNVLHAYSTADRTSVDAMCRVQVLHLIPLFSRTRIRVPLDKRGRVFATKAGAILNCVKSFFFHTSWYSLLKICQSIYKNYHNHP